MYKKTEAIILKKTNYTKTDVIATCFTQKEGKKNLLARGLRKKEARLKTALHPLRISNVIMVEGKNFTVVTRAQIIKEYTHLEQSFFFQGLALYLAEIIDRLFPEPEPPGGIFNDIKETLTYLDRSAHINDQSSLKKSQIMLVGLIFKLLSKLGLGPQMKTCTICGSRLAKTQKFYFSSQKGGLVCKKCKKKSDENLIKLTSKEAKLIKAFKNKSPNVEKIDPEGSIRQVKSVALTYLYHLLKERPSTEALLRSL